LDSPVQIKVHLSSIGVSKLADFQVDNDKAAQQPMKENKIDSALSECVTAGMARRIMIPYNSATFETPITPSRLFFVPEGIWRSVPRSCTCASCSRRE
jgi:hypothetical protein